MPLPKPDNKSKTQFSNHVAKYLITGTQNERLVRLLLGAAYDLSVTNSAVSQAPNLYSGIIPVFDPYLQSILDTNSKGNAFYMATDPALLGHLTIGYLAGQRVPNFNGGDFYELPEGPLNGMGIARRIAHLTYRTESEMDVRFGRELQGDDTGRWAVESYLDHHADKLAKRFDANTYISLTDAMNSHDVGRGRGGVAAALATITVPTYVMAIETDRLFPPRLQEEIAELTPTSAAIERLNSPFGHDGFLIEVETVGDFVRRAVAAGSKHLK